MRSGIDHIDFVRVAATTSFRFSISPSGHCTNRICGPITSESEARAKLLPDFDIFPGLIDGDNVARHNLLLRHSLNHFLSEIIDGLHLGGLECDLASLGTKRLSNTMLVLEAFSIPISTTSPSTIALF